MMILFGVLVFFAFTLLDFSYTRFNQSVQLGLAIPAAIWSVLAWSASTLGFVVAIKVSLWVLPFEAAGLALGAWLAVRYPPATHTIPQAIVIDDSSSRRCGFKL